MKTFRTKCAKNNQKVELIVKYDSLEEAKESLHKQGYSILEITEVAESQLDSGVFYFEAIINGSKKSGQIKSNDIFRAYRVLVEDLHYDVVSIYDDKDIDEIQKQLVTARVKESFNFYKSQQKEKKAETVVQPVVEKKSEKDTEQLEEISPILKKELDRYYLLIDKVIQKIEDLLSFYQSNISLDLKGKLENLIVSLRQVKNITNVDKLRVVGETALLKIGEVEKSFLEQNATEEKKKFLQETNKLLHDFGSQKKVKPQEKDALDFIKNVYTDFFAAKEEKKEAVQTYSYYKTLRELHIYKQKLRQVNWLLFKNKFSFDKDARVKLHLKKKLIIQNITLLENRLKNRKFSYTKIIKQYEYYKQLTLSIIQTLGNVFIFSIGIYSLYFLVSQAIHSFLKTPFEFNTSSIYFIVLLGFFAFLSRITRNVTTITIVSLLYITFFIFIQINLS